MESNPNEILFPNQASDAGSIHLSSDPGNEAPSKPSADEHDSEIEDQYDGISELEDGSKEVFNSMEEAEAYLKSFARINGFAVLKRSTSKYPKCYGEVNFIDFECHRGAVPTPKKNPLPEPTPPPKPRSAGSYQINCPFKVIVRRQTPTAVLEVIHGSHNHERTEDSSIPDRRREYIEDHKGEIFGLMSGGAGCHPRHVMDYLKRMEEPCPLRIKDLYNLRDKFQRQFLDGKTPTKALIN
ncbi:uncharacterized protein DSM5745_09161 [Aspergillus mulundensis]|uniref:FAR1 domain-containing protein n=1 Tax=Aspergillus mulundensis TaxID=1810919 RepID=A0A3D8QZW3_9EURO|nr:hypothetical protein DSM5745_09161 [Aspergillus mulundensis]RDW67295.1 hypothetical protein DSM5745_09161 [Aspergillus mulundensis]